MEASALQAPAAVARTRISLAAPLLRLRSDEQLVALFRTGHEEAFRVIHDRYRPRLFAYTRQMLPRRQDAEDALQDVFVRAYAGLRANERALALRPWLYRVAHNRCIDELRRPPAPPAEAFELEHSPIDDPIAQADQRESLRDLIADLRRLPDQQRSALLMRELSGMSYIDLADALGISVSAVKSLLVRARIALAKALEARDTACADIQEELMGAHDRGVRPNGTARRHMRDCAGCREFRHQLRGTRQQLAALVPAVGPLAVAGKLLGLGGGAGSSAAAGGGAAAGSGAVATGGGAITCMGAVATGASHVATLLVAAAVTAGGAVEIQRTIAPSPPPHHHASTRVSKADNTLAPSAAVSTSQRPVAISTAQVARAAVAAPAPAPAAPARTPRRARTNSVAGGGPAASGSVGPAPADPGAGSPGTAAGTNSGTSALTSGSAATSDPASGSDTNASAGTSAGTGGSTPSSVVVAPGQSPPGSQPVAGGSPSGSGVPTGASPTGG